MLPIAIALLVSEPVSDPNSDPPDTAEMPEAADRTGPVEPESKSSTTPVPGFPPEVDLWNEQTWSELTAAQKDELRAERARRVARGEQPSAQEGPADGMTASSEPAPVSRVRYEQPAVSRRARVDLPEYWEEKHQRLIGVTTGFAITWGLGLAGSLGVGLGAPPSRGTIAGAALLGVAATVGAFGTAISAAMLGAHNNARPLYFSLRAPGLAFRF